MQMTNILSTTIDSIGYNNKTSSLRINFKNMTVYEYSDVPSNVYADLMRASSKGRYVKANISERYSSRKNKITLNEKEQE